MARSCHRRRRCVVQFLLALDILSARIRNPCTKIYFSVINVHSFYDPRREYAKESVSMKLNQSSTVSRLFLGRLSGNEKREREKWRISLTMAKISTVKFYRGFRETIGHMAVICVYFTRRYTLRFFDSVHSFVSPLLAWGGIVLPRNTSGSITTRTNFFARFSNGCKASRESLKARLWRKYRGTDENTWCARVVHSLSRVLKGYIFRRNVSMV